MEQSKRNEELSDSVCEGSGINFGISGIQSNHLSFAKQLSQNQIKELIP